MIPGSGRYAGEGDRLPTPVFLGLPCGSAGKQYTCNVGDLGLIPGLGRSPGEGKGYPLQDSGLEKSMDCVVQDSHMTAPVTLAHTLTFYVLNILLRTLGFSLHQLSFYLKKCAPHKLKKFRSVRFNSCLYIYDRKCRAEPSVNNRLSCTLQYIKRQGKISAVWFHLHVK